jgi:uncharacterized protein YecE (DUF72 family)
VPTLKNLRSIYIGTSGWSISKHLAPGSRPGASSLERYAEYFNAVEINSTFYRLPRRTTVERWRDASPDGFRFAVKVPRSITHEARLVGVDDEVSAFCELCAGFESKLGPVLLQLPPSFALDVSVLSRFLQHFTRVSKAQLVLEPRHPTWFVPTVERLLAEHGVARVAADPACCAAAALPFAGRRGVYFRWHGSPRRYFSAYLPEAITALAAGLIDARRTGGPRSETFCFFDNTALGAAAVNAISLKAEVLVSANGVKRRAECSSDADCATLPIDRAAR